MTAFDRSLPQKSSPQEGNTKRELDNLQDCRPSLSAMFDGEATEQDLQRLIEADTVELSRQLEGFHAIQQALHKDDLVAVGLEDSLLKRVRAGIEEDAVFPEGAIPFDGNNVLPFSLSNDKARIRSFWTRVVPSVAVAASVAMAVILAGNVFLSPNTPTHKLVAEVKTPANTMVITPLSELDKHTLQVDNVRLQHYLRQHAEQAAMTVGQGMIPMARVVSYPVQE